jgi:transposase
MPKAKDDFEAKRRALEESGTYNRHAEDVHDPLFSEGAFFDPRDLTQVKYEMLRRVQKEKAPVAEAASRFGFSRPSFYKAAQDFAQRGLAGLIPRKRGPKGRHKLSPEIMDYVAQVRAADPSIKTLRLLDLVQEKFGMRVHRRTLERALLTSKKKPRQG